MSSRVGKIVKDAVAPDKSVLFDLGLEVPSMGEITEENVRHAGLSITD